MVKVLFQALGNKNIRLGIGRQGDKRRKIDITALPNELTEDVVGDGVYVTAVDINFMGGKPLGTIHAWTNTLKELVVGKTIVEESIEIEGIRVTKER